MPLSAYPPRFSLLFAVQSSLITFYFSSDACNNWISTLGQLSFIHPITHCCCAHSWWLNCNHCKRPLEADVQICNNCQVLTGIIFACFGAELERQTWIMTDILILEQMLLSSIYFKSNSIALKFNIRIYSFTEVHIISSSEINHWSPADVERYSNECILHGIQSKTVSYQSLTLLESSMLFIELLLHLYLYLYWYRCVCNGNTRTIVHIAQNPMKSCLISISGSKYDL